MLKKRLLKNFVTKNKDLRNQRILSNRTFFIRNNKLYKRITKIDIEKKYRANIKKNLELKKILSPKI